MNNDSSLEKSQKLARNLIPWIIGSIISLLVLCGFYFIYQNSGYKEYRASLSYLSGLTADKKTIEYNRFFSIGSIENVHSGILAASWNRGLLMWGVSGLTYYSIRDLHSNGNTYLYYINDKGGCAEASKEVEDLQANYSDASLKSRFFEHLLTNPFIDMHQRMSTWRAAVHPGNYVQVITNGQNNRAISVIVEAEFKGSKNWVICTFDPYLQLEI